MQQRIHFTTKILIRHCLHIPASSWPLISLCILICVHYILAKYNYVIIILYLLMFCCSAGQICSQSYTTYAVTYQSRMEYYVQVYSTDCGFWDLSRCNRTR